MNSGGFFAIDRRTWKELCERGTINEAAAYLVLAQGTGGSNRLTSWSVTSLKTYAGISWARGTQSVQRLTELGFLRPADNSTKERPRYELPSYEQITQALSDIKFKPLNDYERLLIKKIQDGALVKRANATLSKLEAAGLLRRDVSGNYSVINSIPLEAVEPEQIWLPNTIITGTHRNEELPIRRLRSAGDLWTLRLFIDLYHAQNLRDDGGISPAVLRQQYERKMVGEQGIFRIWAFRPGIRTIWWNGPFSPHETRKKAKPEDDHPIWDSVYRLERQGLLVFVPHLWDHDPASGQCGGDSQLRTAEHGRGYRNPT
jgi:hypothetical protein